MSFNEGQGVVVHFLFVQLVIYLVACFGIYREGNVLYAEILILFLKSVESLSQIAYGILGTSVDEDRKVLIDLSEFRRLSHNCKAACHLSEE